VITLQFLSPLEYKAIVPYLVFHTDIENDSKLLSGFPWPIKGNTDNNLESLCIMGRRQKKISSQGLLYIQLSSLQRRSIRTTMNNKYMGMILFLFRYLIKKYIPIYLSPFLNTQRRVGLCRVCLYPVVALEKYWTWAFP
jgi:hypothetical protein